MGDRSFSPREDIWNHQVPRVGREHPETAPKCPMIPYAERAEWKPLDTPSFYDDGGTENSHKTRLEPEGCESVTWRKSREAPPFRAWEEFTLRFTEGYLSKKDQSAPRNV